MRREIVGAVAERIGESHQYSRLLQRHTREEGGAPIEELHRERSRPPRSLVKQAAQVHPIAEAHERYGRQHLRASAKVLARRLPRAPGLARQLQPILRPRPQLLVRKLIAHRIRGAQKLRHKTRRKRRELLLVECVELAAVRHSHGSALHAWGRACEEASFPLVLRLSKDERGSSVWPDPLLKDGRHHL